MTVETWQDRKRFLQWIGERTHDGTERGEVLSCTVLDFRAVDVCLHNTSSSWTKGRTSLSESLASDRTAVLPPVKVPPADGGVYVLGGALAIVSPRQP